GDADAALRHVRPRAPLDASAPRAASGAAVDGRAGPGGEPTQGRSARALAAAEHAAGAEFRRGRAPGALVRPALVDRALQLCPQERLPPGATAVGNGGAVGAGVGHLCRGRVAVAVADVCGAVRPGGFLRRCPGARGVASVAVAQRPGANGRAAQSARGDRPGGAAGRLPGAQRRWRPRRARHLARPEPPAGFADWLSPGETTSDTPKYLWVRACVGRGKQPKDWHVP